MKRIWTAAAMTAVMIILCGALLLSVRRITDEVLDGLEALRAAKAGDTQVTRMIDELRERWDSHEGALTIHVRHSEIEEVTRALTQMKCCWELGEYELYIVACDEAKVAMEHLWEAARPSLKNIL